MEGWVIGWSKKAGRTEAKTERELEGKEKSGRKTGMGRSKTNRSNQKSKSHYQVHLWFPSKTKSFEQNKNKLKPLNNLSVNHLSESKSNVVADQ